MSNTANTQHVVNSGGGSIYLALVAGNDGAAVTQATFGSISRAITNTKTSVVQTDAVVVADTVFDSEQTDANLWSETWNFKDQIEASKITSRIRYLLQYTFTPAAGEVFKSTEIDLIGD